jgi:hypothetical protein
MKSEKSETISITASPCTVVVAHSTLNQKFFKDMKTSDLIPQISNNPHKISDVIHYPFIFFFVHHSKNKGENPIFTANNSCT